jgi:hypothetical protein
MATSECVAKPISLLHMLASFVLVLQQGRTMRSDPFGALMQINGGHQITAH